MKLLYCPSCKDIRKPKFRRKTYCSCKLNWIKNIDGVKVQVSKDAIVLGIDNYSLGSSIIHHGFYPSYEGELTKINAFVMKESKEKIERIL